METRAVADTPILAARPS